MATGTNGIATEGEAKEKLGYSGSVDTNKCCTKARAVAMGADSSKLTSYKDNQLVKYSDLYQAGLDPDTAPYGVYICDNKGRLWKREDWDTASNSKASGVAVIFTTYYKFVIAKEEQKGIEWGGYGTLINFCTTTTDLNRAKTDYNGKDNTDSIIAQLGESETYAARYCKEYVFPHGAEFIVGLRNWNVGVENRLFYGTDMMPYYDCTDAAGVKYGNSLYFGDTFFRVTENRRGLGIYDRLEIYYEPGIASFLTLRIGAVLHFNEGFSGWQQTVSLRFDLSALRRG